MYLKISKEKLSNAISIASKALSKKIIQIERSHLLFTIKDQFITVSGTNNDLKSCVTFTLDQNDSEKQYSFTADPKILTKLLSNIDTEIIQIEFDSEDLTLKIFTSENKKSFNTLQSFPIDKMLVVDGYDKPLDVEYKIPTVVFRDSLNFCQNYLEMRDENKKFDFIIYNKGVAFGSNGSNQMGFFVGTEIKDVENLKIRKIAVPLLISILGKIENENVIIGEQGNNITLQDTDKSIYFSFLKSSIESPKISMDMLKKEGPYTEVDRIELSKKLKRLFSTKTSISGSGIDINLIGAGSNASVEISLLANLKAKEIVQAQRIGDDSIDDISHIVDCNLFKSSVSSFTGDILNLYINENKPFFRIYEVIKNDDTKKKYIKVGVGSYSRIVKQ